MVLSIWLKGTVMITEWIWITFWTTNTFFFLTGWASTTTSHNNLMIHRNIIDYYFKCKMVELKIKIGCYRIIHPHEYNKMLLYWWKCKPYMYLIKGVMNWEIKIPLIFWHIRGQHTIKISCKFQNSKLSWNSKKTLIYSIGSQHRVDYLCYQESSRLWQ